MIMVPEEVATPSERLAPGGTASILLGDTPEVFFRDAAPQHMMMPISGNASASESAAELCGVATILLGDTPMKETFIREDMPHNMQMTLPEPATPSAGKAQNTQLTSSEPAPPTERMAPGGTATISLGSYPDADAFIRADMPHNTHMALPEPA